MVDRFKRFSYAIFEISRCWHKLAADEMGRYGLKEPHAIYLTALEQTPEGCTAAQLAELFGMLFPPGRRFPVPLHLEIYKKSAEI